MNLRRLRIRLACWLLRRDFVLITFYPDPRLYYEADVRYRAPRMLHPAVTAGIHEMGLRALEIADERRRTEQALAELRQALGARL